VTAINVQNLDPSDAVSELRRGDLRSRGQVQFGARVRF
jgi:hypothetical protein